MTWIRQVFGSYCFPAFWWVVFRRQAPPLILLVTTAAMLHKHRSPTQHSNQLSIVFDPSEQLFHYKSTFSFAISGSSAACRPPRPAHLRYAGRPYSAIIMHMILRNYSELANFSPVWRLTHVRSDEQSRTLRRQRQRPTLRQRQPPASRR